MSLKESIVHIATISELHAKAGGPPPEHPLLSVIDMNNIPPLPEDIPKRFTYGFYCVGLKQNLHGYIHYGRQSYDFQEGVMGFTAPNQVMSYENLIAEGATGWLMFFHPELLSHHRLAKTIYSYHFFAYDVSEALHLSPGEEQVMINLFQNMHTEYHLPIDRFSKHVILSNLELLLTYANRYYTRQFITRHEVDHTLVSKFEQELNTYFSGESLEQNGLPRVDYFAKKLNISPNYLSDLLKTLTGKTAKEHIHFHLIERAKNLLLGTNLSVSEISYQLGFEYPQYFSRLFKEKTGHSPKAYRLQAK